MTSTRVRKNFKIRGSKNLRVDGLTTRTRKVCEVADEIWNFYLKTQIILFKSECVLNRSCSSLYFYLSLHNIYYRKLFKYLIALKILSIKTTFVVVSYYLNNTLCQFDFTGKILTTFTFLPSIV